MNHKELTFCYRVFWVYGTIFGNVVLSVVPLFRITRIGQLSLVVPSVRCRFLKCPRLAQDLRLLQ